MYLLLTTAAAIITTVLWYKRLPNREMKLGLLSLMYWGASVMWLVDALFASIAEGEAFFEISVDALVLGITVVIAGAVLWLVVLLIQDPRNVLHGVLFPERTAKKNTVDTMKNAVKS